MWCWRRKTATLRILHERNRSTSKSWEGSNQVCYNKETLKTNREEENKCQPDHHRTNSYKIENPFNNLEHTWLQLPSKKYRQIDWINALKPTLCYLRNKSSKDIEKLSMKGYKLTPSKLRL